MKKRKPRKHAVLLDKASLAVHEVATEDSGRYLIDHVHVEQDGTAVGLNGKLLLAVEPVAADPADLPATVEPTDVPEGGFNLSAKACAVISHNLKAGTAYRPVLQNAVVTRCDEEFVEMSSTDLKRVKREGEVPTEGTFPPWKEIIERPWMDEEHDEAGAGPVAQLGLKIEVLEQIVKAIKKMHGGDEDPFVRFTFNLNMGHVLIDGTVSGDRRFIGAIGRITTKSEDRGLEDLNDWQDAILNAGSKEAEDEED